MATASATADASAAGKSSPMAFVAAMLVLTGIGVGFGGLLGLHLPVVMEAAVSREPRTQPGQGSGQTPAQAAKSSFPAGTSLRSLSPIVTNLASPAHSWIRLEAMLVTESLQAPDASVLEAQITEDIVAFLRTLALVQIQGPSGFQHLREDLIDRVRVRSGGKVRDLVVQSLIVE
jgi:flagellar FliL protein